MAVRFDVMARPDTRWSNVTTLAAKPEVFAACRLWLGSAGGGRDLREVPHVADAAALAADDGTIAAIAPGIAGEPAGLVKLFDHVGDEADATGRYFVLGHRPAQPGSDDKTAVLFTTPDRPGALATVLDTFSQAGVNLSDIEKRPTGTRRRQYMFFVELDAHLSDPALRAAAERAREHCQELLIVGSYPRATQVA